MIREKDQTFCPKCRRMYCEGYWGEGVCTADMHFGSEPTSRGDQKAEYLRVWYEAHRESWFERWWRPVWKMGLADNFMLGLLQEVRRIEQAAATDGDARNDS